MYISAGRDTEVLIVLIQSLTESRDTLNVPQLDGALSKANLI